MGVATCAEACARAGETCNDTDAYCAGYVEVYLTDGPNDEDPQEDVDSCFQQFSGESSFRLACDEPIPWDFETDGRTVAGVACCCTQP